MSLLRRRMMMASSVKEPDVPDTPTEELDYLTIIPLHEEEEYYYIYPHGGLNDFGNHIYTQEIPFYYRINRGEWVEVNLPDSDSLIWEVKLNKDTELQLKCMGCNFSNNYLIDTQYFKIISDGYHNVSGTPMSLLYGDGFKENNYVVSYTIYGLFTGDRGLTKILNPKTFLPYTKLGDYCYEIMFFGCVNLTNAPELPADILASGCYFDMFRDCQKINYIKMLATDISAEFCLANWVSNVSPTGTFVKHPDMTSLPTGIDGIPEGWVVLNDGEESGGGNDFGIEFPLYLYFDYCEDMLGGGRYCERAEDDLSFNLHNYFAELAKKYGDFLGDDILGYYTISEQIFNTLGIDLYIGGNRVIEFSLSTDTSIDPSNFTVTGEFRYISIYENGKMRAEY